MTPAHAPPLASLPAPVTELLVAWSGGDRAAGESLLAAVYEELRRQATRAMRAEAPGHTLQPTALVNEAYLRLRGQQRVAWENRAHFFGVAAQLMRRILVDHARARLSAKRGGHVHRISLGAADPADAAADAAQDVDVLALHEALERLAELDPEQERLVELRYFCVMTIEETAHTLGISPATVKREWLVARAWLRRELEPQ